MKRGGFVLLLALVWAGAAVRAEIEGGVADDPRGRQAARAIEEGVRTSADRLRGWRHGGGVCRTSPKDRSRPPACPAMPG